MKPLLCNAPKKRKRKEKREKSEQKTTQRPCSLALSCPLLLSRAPLLCTHRHTLSAREQQHADKQRRHLHVPSLIRARGSGASMHVLFVCVCVFVCVFVCVCVVCLRLCACVLCACPRIETDGALLCLFFLLPFWLSSRPLLKASFVNRCLVCLCLASFLSFFRLLLISSLQSQLGNTHAHTHTRTCTHTHMYSRCRWKVRMCGRMGMETSFACAWGQTTPRTAKRHPASARCR